MLKNIKIETQIIAWAIFNSILFTLLFAYLFFVYETDVMKPIDAVSFDLALIALAVILFIIMVSTNYLIKSVATPINVLEDTIKKAAKGDMQVRVNIEDHATLSDIGSSINELLDDRDAIWSNYNAVSSSDTKDENEALNDSIITLLETVAQMAHKDLTIRAKVSEDVTGPIADAINLLISEISDVLSQVVEIAEETAEISNMVKSESDRVMVLENNEKNEIEQTIEELKSVSEMINKIHQLTETSNTTAETTVKTTTTAMSTVKDTVSSINLVGETTRETEKRVKRLGERSQEIGVAVNLVNNISERTHVLALNASMQAALAGEAGRGFAIVADEVQRLAEGSREATAEIGMLVNNIQTEIANTVHIINALADQMSNINDLSEKVGEDIQKTELTTTNLAHIIKKIAQQASEQSIMSNQLLERARLIHDGIHDTEQHLKTQTTHTHSLLEKILSMVASISVFTLEKDDGLETDITKPADMEEDMDMIIDMSDVADENMLDLSP